MFKMYDRHQNYPAGIPSSPSLIGKARKSLNAKDDGFKYSFMIRGKFLENRVDLETETSGCDKPGMRQTMMMLSVRHLDYIAPDQSQGDQTDGSSEKAGILGLFTLRWRQGRFGGGYFLLGFKVFAHRVDITNAKDIWIIRE
jgi:hypothetical protein